MNNFSISQEATESSLNSTNSSMEEQAKFADSLQGRINRLDTAWNKFTLSTGDAFLTDGLISAVEILGDVANISSAVVDKVGVLSGVFGTAGIAVFALSGNLRTLTTAALFGTQAVSQQALATAGLTTSMRAGTIATIGLTGALRGLLSASIIGGIFVALGFAIEKLISSYANAKREQEEFEESQQKNIDALTKNKAKTEELIEEYDKLSKQKKTGTWDTENEKEYLRIQSEIASVYPALIDHIDSTGQAHLRTSEEIQKEIDLTNKLIEAKKEELKVKAQDEIQKEIDKQKELKEELKDLKKQRESFKDHKGSLGANDKELEKRIKSVETQMVSTEIKISGASQKINDQILKVSDAYSNLEVDPAIQKSVDSLVNSMDFSHMDASEIESTSIKIAELTDNLQKAYESGDNNSYEKVLSDFSKFMKSIGATDVSLGELDLSYDSVKKKTDAVAAATYDGSEAMDGMSESIDDVSDSADQLLKSYEDAVDNITDLNGVLNELNDEDSYGLSADSMGLLIEKYPDLLGYINDESALREQIGKKIEEEKNVALDAMTAKLEGNEQYFNAVIDGNEALINNLAKAYDIDIKNTKSMAQLKAQINSKLMQKLGSEWADYYDAQSMAFTEAGRKMLATMSYQEAINSPQLKAIGDYQVAMRKLSDQLRSTTDSFTGGTIAFEGLDTATKKGSKEYERATYISDKFKKALESVNLALEKQQSIQKKVPKFSKEYQIALKNEILLLEKKKNLINDQTKSLSKQISSGNIAKTGMITSSTSVSSSGGSSSPYSGSLLNRPLTQQSNVTASQINKWINSKVGRSSLMYNSGDAFMRAAAESGLDPLYLVAHAAHETGWGTSRIARSKNNFFGIGAFDSSPYASAYGYNGTTAGIVEGAKWISKNYANGRYGQDTLSKMRFNNGVHQYATDPRWADKIASIMSGSGLTGSSTTSLKASSSSVNISKVQAEGMQDVDAAKSELNQLFGDIIGIDDQISQLRIELINSVLAGYENRQSEIDSHLKIYQTRTEKQNELSKEYRQGLQNQIALMKQKKSLQEQQMVFIENELKKNKNLTEAQKAELQAMYRGLRDGLIDIDNAIVQLNESFLHSALDNFFNRLEKGLEQSSEAIDDLDHKLEMLGESDFGEKKNLLLEKVKLYEQQVATAKKNIDLINSQTKNLSRSASGLAKNNEQLKIWKERLEEANSALRSTKGDLSGFYNSIADDIISSYKEVYEKQKQIELDNLDSQLDAIDSQMDAISDAHDSQMELIDSAHEAKMDALDKEHEATIDALNEELEAYQEVINAKLKSIDKEENERSYGKQLGKLQEDEATLRKKLNELALDDSLEARNKKLQLEEELKDKLEEIEELKHSHEVDLRKENLQDMLKTKEDEINEKIELENDEYEALKEKYDNEVELARKSADAQQKIERTLLDNKKRMLEEERKAIEQKWDNELNDERKFAKIREDILKGNFSNILKDFQSFATFLSANMSSIGQSITYNLIDKLREAQQVLNGVNNSNSSNGLPKWDGMEMREGQIGKITVNKPINLWKRVDGKLKFERILNPGERYRVYGYDDQFGGQYDVGGGYWVTNMPEHISYETPSKDKLNQVTPIGYGSGSGASSLPSNIGSIIGGGGSPMGVQSMDGATAGGMGMTLTDIATQKKLDLKTLLGGITLPPLVNNIAKGINPPSINANTDNSIAIDMPITIGSMSGTKQDADNVFGIIKANLNKLGVR